MAAYDALSFLDRRRLGNEKIRSLSSDARRAGLVSSFVDSNQAVEAAVDEAAMVMDNTEGACIVRRPTRKMLRSTTVRHEVDMFVSIVFQVPRRH
jgi:hypothetical protein